MYNNFITLNNGVKIPQLGLGTWFIDDDKAAGAVKEAAAGIDETLKNFKHIEDYGESGVFPVYGGKL